ncbi:hypothetical protein, partial [Enterobacter cloacae]|uniref:hypothetical protein n=1 Tax=Enterobacter cloacae TaxID=550 RepID=UPI0032DA2DB9
LAQPVDHTSSCFSFFWGTLSPQGEGANPKNGNFGCHFAFTPGFFYAKKSGPRGPQKFTLALVVRVLRETR